MGLILIKGLSIVGTLTTNLTFIFLIFKKNFKSLKNGKHLLKKKHDNGCTTWHKRGREEIQNKSMNIKLNAANFIKQIIKMGTG